jgi:phage repressor protein C with HTH and peptisase S24 domain
MRWTGPRCWRRRYHRRYGSRAVPLTLVPVINRVTAGARGDFTDLDYPIRIADEYVPCPPTGDAEQFAARVVGDSMEPQFLDGDTVVFAPNRSPRSGQPCFVRFAETHETTFKAFYIDPDGMVRLQPLNPAYRSQRVLPEAISGLYPAVYRIVALDG